MLFKDITFYVTPSFLPQRLDTLTKYLTANGGEKSSIEEASHIIADSIRFEGRANVKKDAVVVSVSQVLEEFPLIVG
jgi:hypothetical protein